MIGRLFRGELSVAVTYWGGFVAFNLVMRLGLIAFGGWQLRQFIAGNDAVATGAAVGLMLIGVVWSGLIGRALYKAQYRDRSPSFWSWLGLALIAAGVVTYLYAALQILNPSMRVNAYSISQEVAILNQSLPAEIEPGFIFSQVTFDGTTITYRYEVDGLSGGLPGTVLLPDSEVENLCRDLEGFFRGPLEAAVFQYDFTNETVERILPKEECAS